MRIALIWQGFNTQQHRWTDGLRAAMNLIAEDHEVRFFDFPLDGIHLFNPDVVLYWEAPITQNGKDANNWHEVANLPFKKALMFAGGPLRAIDVRDFEFIFVESAIDAETCEREGIPHLQAFGTNTRIFKPAPLEKKYEAFMHATFADWKRHHLFAAAMGPRGTLAGRKQEHDLNGYEEAVRRHVQILEEQNQFEVAQSINQSYCVLNTASFWGGGQRCTVEAMACGVPVVVMSDSPKNCEFIEKSGGGVIADPDIESIKIAVKRCKVEPELGEKGLAYVRNNLTEGHYANTIMKGIASFV